MQVVTAERCSPSKNNPGSALGKAAVVHFEDKPVCVSNPETAAGGLALSVLYITEPPSGTFQGMVCFGRRESLGLFFLH